MNADKTNKKLYIINHSEVVRLTIVTCNKMMSYVLKGELDLTNPLDSLCQQMDPFKFDLVYPSDKSESKDGRKSQEYKDLLEALKERIQRSIMVGGIYNAISREVHRRSDFLSTGKVYVPAHKNIGITEADYLERYSKSELDTPYTEELTMPDSIISAIYSDIKYVFDKTPNCEVDVDVKRKAQARKYRRYKRNIGIFVLVIIIIVTVLYFLPKPEK